MKLTLKGVGLSLVCLSLLFSSCRKNEEDFSLEELLQGQGMGVWRAVGMEDQTTSFMEDGSVVFTSHDVDQIQDVTVTFTENLMSHNLPIDNDNSSESQLEYEAINNDAFVVMSNKMASFGFGLPAEITFEFDRFPSLVTRAQVRDLFLSREALKNTTDAEYTAILDQQIGETGENFSREVSLEILRLELNASHKSSIAQNPSVNRRISYTLIYMY